MGVFGLNWQFNWVARYGPVALAPKARDRLRALRLWQETKDLQLACRTFGVSRATLYRWRRRFDPTDLTSLHERSRRPRRMRAPRWSLSLLHAVRRVRETFPRWGKDKLVVLLKAEGFTVSASTVGRILTSLREHGRLIEPQRRPIGAPKRRPNRPYARRKPREYEPRLPGDLVQVDTLDIRPLPGVTLKQFTARDVVSRWDVLEARSRATAALAAQFIETLQPRMPFPLRALQVDGGSEFQADFEEACQQRGIRLFILPPRSPKLNGHVERALRTHTEEFYEVTECSWKIEELNQQLFHWERTYNTIRPHQALGYLTPLQFLHRLGMMPHQNPSLSHM